VINFPGGPRSIAQTAEVLLPVLAHALELIAGGRVSH
jgi:molybdopterin biosynthesis enzyme MoaB